MPDDFKKYLDSLNDKPKIVEPEYNWKWDSVYKAWRIYIISPKGFEFATSTKHPEIPKNISMQELARFTRKEYFAQNDQIYVWRLTKFGLFGGKYVPISKIWYY